MSSLAELEAGLQAPSESDSAAARREVRAALEGGSQRLFVVDDDPTGSQTVAGVPLLLRFGDADLRWAADAVSGVVFAVTNSRSVPEERAVAINEQLGARIQRLASARGLEPRVLSRSDSTLRGHFPAEVLALDAGLVCEGAPPLDAILLCPAFVEIGRVTVGDVHWIAQDGVAVPAAETEYARDPVFGYTRSDLREWVAERCGGTADGAAVGRVSLADIREGGVERVTELLGEARGGETLILNAAARTDLDVLAQAISRAESGGRRFIYRTGPSFVAARAGRPTPAPIAPPAVTGPGLVVVGSHSGLTTRQLKAALDAHDLRVVELKTSEVTASPRRRAGEVRRVVGESHHSHPGGTVLATSRTAAPVHTLEEAIAVKAAIADALTDATREIVARRRPGFVVAKGGVTSHDVARNALATGRATVLGQLFPGQIALWRLEDSELAPGVPYVVFPGNVGDEDALAATLDRLRENAA